MSSNENRFANKVEKIELQKKQDASLDQIKTLEQSI